MLSLYAVDMKSCRYIRNEQEREREKERERERERERESERKRVLISVSYLAFSNDGFPPFQYIVLQVTFLCPLLAY